MIISEWILGNEVGRCGLDSYGSGQGPRADYEHSNEPFGSIKGGEFIDLALTSHVGLCSME
jgi:hypothetical protein